MESMIEEIIGRFKPLTEEELYRIVQTLLHESYQQSNSRLGNFFFFFFFSNKYLINSKKK